MTTPDIAAQCERLRGKPGGCPFCGGDPYHCVDIGVGMERVAVVCCDEGIALFQHGDPVLLAQVLFRIEAADTIERQAAEIERLRELLRCIRDTPANEFDAVNVANRLRAALTGEDA